MNAISEEKIMTDQDLAVLGGGEVAYLREISPKMRRKICGATTTWCASAGPERRWGSPRNAGRRCAM